MIIKTKLSKSYTDVDWKSLGFEQHWKSGYFDLERGCMIPDKMIGYHFKMRIYVDDKGNVTFFTEYGRSDYLNEETKWKELISLSIISEVQDV